VNEIIKLIGAHNLLTTPSLSEMHNPQLRPLIEHYYRGAKEHTADERVKVFRAAWDFAGTAFAGRNELYERFYLASASRMYQVAHAAAQAALRDKPSLLDRILHHDGEE
jgi:4-hydroxyphenylacetate 3-monooxygenase